MDSIFLLLENFSPELDFWGLVTLCSEEHVRTYLLARAVFSVTLTLDLLHSNKIILLFQGRE